jgi:photosystem II stability/assembly factor-like uncharacterized protein
LFPAAIELVNDKRDLQEERSMQRTKFRLAFPRGFNIRKSWVRTTLLLSVLVPLAIILRLAGLDSKQVSAPTREAGTSRLQLSANCKLKGAARKAAGAEWFISQRSYGLGYIPQDAEVRAVEYVRRRMIPELQAQRSLQKSAAASMQWQFHGPGNIGGRVRGLVVHPDNPNILYTGSVAGGVWKSTDGGASWFPTMDDLITLNISALEMKPGDPNTLYAGTGEGFLYLDNLPGRGILKTTNGGNTWQRVHVAQGLNSPFITAIAVSPADPNVVYASGREAIPQIAAPDKPSETVPNPGVSAIFKSTDSGETWKDITTGKGIDHDRRILTDDLPADVVVSPTDANVVYATFGLYYPGGIWKSTDGGQTWSRLTNGLPDPKLPNMGYGRIKLAMAPSDPNVLYASFTYDYKRGDTVDLKEWAMLGVWKTTDGGQNWTQVSTPLTSSQYNRNHGETTALGSQGNYANAIIVHPTDPNIVFAGGLDIYKSIDGGNSWSQVSIWIDPGDSGNPEKLPYVHGDHHVFAFDRSTDPPTLYNGSDGGIARSRDLGKTWGILNKDLGVTQFYTFAVHPTDPKVMLGGTQDNGTPMLRSDQVNLWHDITDGDGWQVFFDYTDPTRIYVSRQQLDMYRAVIDYATGLFTGAKGIGYTDGSNGITQRDAAKAGFFAPYELSPNNPNVLVLGTNRLLQSTNRGDTWTPISAEADTVIVTVAIGEGNDNVIWAATLNAKILKTENNGTTWTSVTHPTLPKRFLTDIEFDPSNTNTVYLTYSGYGAPHVFKSMDAGANWTNITNNLPDVPANAIQVHPQQPNVLFLGTDIGVFLSDDGGQTWQPCTNGFPTAQVTAIVLNPNANRVYAATHGRGAYSAELGSSGAAALNIDVSEISLQLQPDHSRSTAFTISNSGNVDLNYSITATGPITAPVLTNKRGAAVHLSALASGNQPRLPKFDLATVVQSRADKGMTPVLSVNAAATPASLLSQHTVSSAEVLYFDDGDNFADTFLGWGAGSANNFNWANVFSAPESGFRLESFDFYLRTESVSADTFYFEVNDANGKILTESELILPTAPSGGWYRVPILNPLIFNADSSFSIVVGASKAIGHPAGADVDASVPNNSFYLDPGQNKYVALSTASGFENGAFLIRANGTKMGAANRLSANPPSGTIAPGGSQTITVTFDAQGLAEGNYQGQLYIASNGGDRTVPVQILVSNTVGVDDNFVELPRAFRLEQNYPNPFNPETSIRYELPHDGNITLTVFELNGRRVALLESGLKKAGQHLLRWDGRDQAGNRVPSGVYFYRLEAISPAGTTTTLAKKLTVLK